MDATLRTVIVYQASNGKEPFTDWFNGLKDRRVKAAVDARLTRVRLGNLGASRSLGDGIWELKIDLGPGFRVYFGQHDGTVVILLCGGDKQSQAKDIELAKVYWNEYANDKGLK